MPPRCRKTGPCSSISARSPCASTTSAEKSSRRTTPAPTDRRASPTASSTARKSNARCTRGSFTSRPAKRSARPAPRISASIQSRSRAARCCSRNSETVEKVSLTLAIGDYEHTRDVVTGQVPVQGVSLNVLNLPPEEAFFRFTFFREWEISEMSMGKYVSLRSQEDEGIAAIPVFPSRVFRQSMIYVRDGGKIDRPEQLKGKRIGVPERAQTAVIYSRGYLTHQAKVPLGSVEWVQAGANQTGRVGEVKPQLPQGARLRPEPPHPPTASHAPLAWLAASAERMKILFGEDFWPYGLEKNRTSPQAFVDFAFEQGVCHRLLEPEELFPKQVLTSFKV